MHVARHAEVGRVDDLVGGRVGEDRFGVDPGFVREGAEARHWVVEGDVDFHGRGHEVLERLQLREIVFRAHVVPVQG